MDNFNQSRLNPSIIKAITEMGFEIPTPIQAKTIPHLLASADDLIATAQTGTGKTAAFGLPSIHLTNLENRSTQTLVLCPTRELCIQIAKDIGNYSKYIDKINILAIYGGAGIHPQIKSLKKGAQIVIGTPGRTKDLIKRKKLDISHVTRVILDEADEMLSMGFKEDLELILDQTPNEKQTLLFSATMSKRVLKITKLYMNNPLEISAKRRNIAADNVQHIYYMVNAKDRYEVVKRIIDINPEIYGIVFCRTRRETKDVANKLIHDGYNADTLNGDLSQMQRDEVMGNFRNNHLQILVATDVAARGLDVDNLSHVINYNLPDDDEIYVHRSGRTGRAGKNGISIIIVHTREMRKIEEIEKKYDITFIRHLVPEGLEICKKRLYNLIDRVETVAVDEQQISKFLPDIYKKLEWLNREELIKHFVSMEFNRYLSYYKNARDINIYKIEKGKKRGTQRKQIHKGRLKTAFTGFYINVGTNHKVNPARLIGLINKCLQSRDVIIGKIKVMKTFSFFEIDNEWGSKLFVTLKGKKFAGISLLIEKDKGSSIGKKRTKVKSKIHDNNVGRARTRKKRNKGGSRRKRL
ncbi:MAG: DEAD/DEAH box helicase [Candidatus Marinimicrobia bacterium]|nr:DEAD/DEAH box helicase [Candidatus Neomarinimicrobiota bacterium]|tara:strand:- start:13285 stop:15027 length:1743 start_codon:yes stop_codon:yes gene_type:complete